MTNQQGAPEALRPEMLDDLIETFATAGLGRHNLMRVELSRHQWAQLAVALSRLHAKNERPAALVEAQQPAHKAPQQAAPSTDQVEEILRERDDAEDFIDALLDEVLGHERPEWSSAYGRADALNDVRERMTALHKPAVDKAWDQFQSAMEAPQQPAPSAASKAVLAAIRAANMQLVRTGDDEFMLVTLKQATPQADSQPAPVRDESAARDECKRRWLAEDEDCNLLEAYDRGWKDRAARTSAASVTAPVGGATYHLGACIVDGVLFATVMRKEPGRAGAVTVLLSAQIPVEHLQDRDVIVDVTPPAQAADSAQEDAAREAIDKVLALFPFNATTQAFTIGGGPHLTADGDTEFYSVKRVLAFLTEIKNTLDAARKQGGATWQ